MKRIRFGFALRCALVSGGAMLVSMLLGEALADPDLFGGLWSRPLNWLLVFVESAIWVVPLTYFGTFALPVRSESSQLRYAARAALVWLGVGSTIVLAYKLLYFPREPANLANRVPETVFGWALPCLVIWGAFVFESMKFRERLRGFLRAP